MKEGLNVAVVSKLLIFFNASGILSCIVSCGTYKFPKRKNQGEK